MSLYAVELDTDKFDYDLVESITKQAGMNRAICEHLKPRRQMNENGLREIKFADNCPIKDYFDSAIKAWRIL